jgi:hypothetical protein
VEKGEELRVLAQAVWTLEEVLEAPRALEVEVDHALLDEKGVARLKEPPGRASREASPFTSESRGLSARPSSP